MISRFVAVPLPLVQIAFGAGLAWLLGVKLTFDPEIFLVIFVAPLLFVDAWRFPRTEFRRLRGVILTLALGLVLFTVTGAGFFINWLIPSMPMAVAFCLAAALAPTDAVAVAGIRGGAPIPSRLMHVLEAEGLFNDASGLVCLRFAIAAVLTGAFSPWEASVQFGYVAVGGALIGLAVATALHLALRLIAKATGDHGATRILTSILLPFGAYLAAEHVHTSGIMAAVAAGLAYNFIPDKGETQATTRIQSSAVWDMLQFGLNGFIFVLLGLQLPAIFAGAPRIAADAGLPDVWRLVYYAFAITGALILLRLAWVFASLKVMIKHARRRGMTDPDRPSGRLMLAMAIGGARGAITLAAALSIPLTLADGTAFPSRDLVIELAVSVILIWLVLASIALPLLFKNVSLPTGGMEVDQEMAALAAGAHAAITAVEAEQHRLAAGREDADTYADAAVRVMARYRERIEAAGEAEDQRHQALETSRIERRLFLAGVRAERTELNRRQRAGEIEDGAAARLIRQLDAREAALLEGL